MRNLTRLVIVLLLIGFTGFSVAEIYKWVDDKGVVHYSENSPEDQAASEVELSEPPSEEEVDAARRIYQPVIEEQAAKQDGDAQTTEKPAKAGPSSAAVLTPERAPCLDAYLALQILDGREAVYEDESGRLHASGSLHSFWYDGYRRHLQDSDRREKSEHYEQVMKDRCDLPRREIRRYAPIYEKQRVQGMCGVARAKLSHYQQPGSKTDRHAVEEAEELIERWCD